MLFSLFLESIPYAEKSDFELKWVDGQVYKVTHPDIYWEGHFHIGLYLGYMGREAFIVGRSEGARAKKVDIHESAHYQFNLIRITPYTGSEQERLMEAITMMGKQLFSKRIKKVYDIPEIPEIETIFRNIIINYHKLMKDSEELLKVLNGEIEEDVVDSIRGFCKNTIFYVHGTYRDNKANRTKRRVGSPYELKARFDVTKNLKGGEANYDEKDKGVMRLYRFIERDKENPGKRRGYHMSVGVEELRGLRMRGLHFEKQPISNRWEILEAL